LMNQGALDAPFSCIPSATNVGSCFKFAPEEGIIAAGGSQTVQISFSATMLGSFEEEFQFGVAGSPTPAILTINTDPCWGGSSRARGSLGLFQESLQAFLHKGGAEAAVAQSALPGALGSLWVLPLRVFPSLTRHVGVGRGRRQFIIVGLFNVHLTVTNVFCSISQSLGVNILHSLSISDPPGVISLPRCLIPELQVSSPVLLYNECHLKVPYERKVIIRNPSHLPGCYRLIPQKCKEDSAVFYSSPKPCGIVQPPSTAENPTVVEVQSLGTHSTNVV
ncbi:HYDIN protein, partial [Emberiza fucata]|nr:HYDIN protein [Emberiza fucata]